jgi:hypothetical protein
MTTQANNVIAQLEKRGYLVKDNSDITALAKAALVGDKVPGTYLRALVASAQVRTGMEAPRTTALRGRIGEPADIDADVATVTAVHDEFYALVLKAVTTEDIAPEKGLRKAEAARRAKERNRRSNFARSAKSTLTKFVRAGGNIRGLCVLSVTKRQLRELTAQKQGTQAASTEEQAKRFGARIVRALEEMKEQDEGLAQLALQAAITELSARSADWFSKRPTTSAKKAQEHGQLLKTEDGLFWPVSLEPKFEQAQQTVQ